jgi:hypothetical protein
MTKTIIYTYLGTNGTLSTPIYLEGIYSVKNYNLIADKDKQLTKDGKHFYNSITVPENEVDQWYEA